MKENSDEIRRAFRVAFSRSLPVMAGYLFLGIGFGILLQSKGYEPWFAVLMSVTIYAGSMQYVAVDLLSGGATLVAAAMMTVMVNARHIFYGISMLDKYKNTGKKKPFLIFALTDETYSIVCSAVLPVGVDRNYFYLFLSLLNQSYWVMGSLLGAVLGSLISFNSQGIDFAMTSLFVVIFTEQWKSNKNHIPALTGLGITLLCLLIFGADQFVIPAMILITATLTVFRGRLSGKEVSND